ncbi:MAG: VWA domain-containing protein [Acidobacteria bacterium]|nr:VWA domain-containing protein [Acidobacteriota bacterium]
MRLIMSLCVVSLWLSAAWRPAFSQAPPQAVLDIVLVLDNSGSMKKNDPQALMREAVYGFASRLSAESRLGIILFDQNVSPILPLTDAATPEFQSRLAESLNRLDYGGRLTDLPAGAERAIYSLRDSRPQAQKVVVLFTDGIVETGNPQKDLERSRWLRESLVQEAKSKGILIFGVALTEAADFELMQSLAHATGGEYFRVLTAPDIPATFEEISSRIRNLGARPAEAAASPQTAPPAPVIVEQNFPWQYLAGGAMVVALLVLTIFFLTKKGQRVSQRPSIVAHLRDVNDQSEKGLYPLSKLIMRMGRDEGSNDIVVPKNTISLKHAVIEFREGNFYLCDLRSTNGTYLNGKKISQSDTVREVVLKHGDKIHLDCCEFEFIEDKLEGVQQTAFVRAEEADALLAAGSNGAIEEIIRGSCPNHPSWKATEVCPMCRVPKCKNCMAQRDGRIVCTDCVAMFKVGKH